jgi:hypothetical protein
MKAGSFADVGVKVLGVPYRVYSPSDHDGNRTLDFAGDLGMCFAGGAVNSLCVKETVADALLRLQHIPGHTRTAYCVRNRIGGTALVAQ